MRKLTRLLLLMLALVASVSITSCRSESSSEEVIEKPDPNDPVVKAQSVKLLAEVQKEGAGISIAFTYNDVDYEASFQKEGEDYRMLAFTSNGVSATANFTPYLTTLIPDSWTEKEVDDYLNKLDPVDDDGLDEDDDFENEGDPGFDDDDDDDDDDGDDDGDDDDDDDDDGDDNKGFYFEDEDEGDDDEGDDDGTAETRRRAGTAVDMPTLNLLFGLTNAKGEDLVQVQIVSSQANATVVGDVNHFAIKNITTNTSALKTRAAGDNTVNLNLKLDKTGKIAVKKVRLDPYKPTLEAGKSLTMTATVQPVNATIETISWKSKKVDIATVDNLNSLTAQVTALKCGKAAIYAFVNKKSGNTSVTVPKVNVTSMKLNTNTLEIKHYATATLVATINPGNASKPKLTWSSSNKKVATVNGNGLIKTKQLGTAVITCRANNGTDNMTADDHVDQCLVTVVPSKVERIEFEKSGGVFKSGKKIKLPKYTLYPKKTTPYPNGKAKDLIWESSDEETASFIMKKDEVNKIDLKSAGTVTITCTVPNDPNDPNDDVTGEFVINVGAPDNPTLGPSGGYMNGEDPIKY